MRCGLCGYNNRADSVYCGQCRAALTRPCPACGEPAPTGAGACLACGASLTATVPLPGAGWTGTPGEATAVYRPVDLAGAGAGGGWLGAEGGVTRFTGVARDVQQRQDEHMLHVDFRIERHDPSGNRLAPVPVEMRGTIRGFAGRVSNGDEIQVVDGTWRDGTLRVRELDNLTTGARVRSGPPTVVQVRHLAVILTIFAAAPLMAYFVAWWMFFPLIVILFAYVVVPSRRLLKGCSGRAASAWRAVFSGANSLPEPVRTVPHPGVAELGAKWMLPDRPVRPRPRATGILTLSDAAQVAPRLSGGISSGLLPGCDLCNAGLPV